MNRVMDRVDQRQLEDAGLRWWERKGAAEEDPEPGACLYCSGVGCRDCRQRGSALVGLLLGVLVGALLALAVLVMQPVVCKANGPDSGIAYCTEEGR